MATDGRMDVRRVAGEQDASLAVGSGLARHVGEPGDPGGTVDPVVGAVDGDEALAQVAQGGLPVPTWDSVSITPTVPPGW